VTTLLLCAALFVAAQTPAQQSRAPATPAKRDTIYVAVQAPPPSVTVEAPSDTPTIVLGILGALLLAAQLWIMAKQTNAMNKQTALMASQTDAMNRQTGLAEKQTALQGQQTEAMNRQTSLLDKQTALAEQQAAWRRDEAVGTFYRIAHELANELRKANVMAGTPIAANSDTQTRQWLREARLLAPLGNDVVFAATASAMYVDLYFEAVASYNKYPRGRDVAQWTTVQQAREQVGRNLDATSLLIPAELRWKYGDGTAYSFRKLCSMPAALAQQIGAPTTAAGEGDG
jgi:hypothetical protein